MTRTRLFLWFICACSFALSRANTVQLNCTLSVLVNADPIAIKDGTIKKGIAFPSLAKTHSISGTDCVSTKKTCFEELPKLVDKTTFVTKNKALFCIVIGPNYNVHVQLNMEYHCIDDILGTEVITNKINRDIPDSPLICV